VITPLFRLSNLSGIRLLFTRSVVTAGILGYKAFKYPSQPFLGLPYSVFKLLKKNSYLRYYITNEKTPKVICTSGSVYSWLIDPQGGKI